MRKTNQSFIKKQKADKRIKKRNDKIKKRIERKKNASGEYLDGDEGENNTEINNTPVE